MLLVMIALAGECHRKTSTVDRTVEEGFAVVSFEWGAPFVQDACSVTEPRVAYVCAVELSSLQGLLQVRKMRRLEMAERSCNCVDSRAADNGKSKIRVARRRGYW